MVVNSLYPGFVKFLYNANSHPHVHVLPVALDTWSSAGGTPDLYNLSTKGGSSVDFGTFVDAYLTLVKALFNTGSEFSVAELWGYTDPDSDPTFLSAYAAAVNGTSATAASPYTQLTLTFRSAAGGVSRITLMEGVTTPNQVNAFPWTGGYDALADYLMGSTSPVIARDGGFLISGIRWAAKTNDALRRKYLLGG